MRILVCGSRYWRNREMIKTAFSAFSQGDTIIHGGCRGADSLAGQIAKGLALNVECYPAQWEQYGKAAGPIRNQEMLDIGQPDLVIAFHNHIESSRGTKDMIRRAKSANVPFVVLREMTDE